MRAAVHGRPHPVFLVPAAEAVGHGSRVSDARLWRNPADFPRGRFMKIRRKNASVRKAPRGQTMTEYAFILATIAIVLVSLYNTAGTIVTELISKVGPLLLGN
jgi:Flp pilus assembly pilin Flp